MMRHFITIVESEEDDLVLFHGTIRDHVDDILAIGLRPSLGEFTKRAYREYEDAGIELPELVFAADRAGLQKCLSAMGHLMMNVHGVNRSEAYGPEGVRRHGALCVIETRADSMYHYPEDEEGYWWGQETYPQAEPGDYFYDMTIKVDRVLVGDELVEFFEKNNVFR